jgi:hypothetical protein
MGYSLVSAGPVALVNPNYTGEISPSFGQATTAGNLLIAFLSSISGSATNPFSTGAAGWQQAAASGGAYQWAAIWYKENCASGETAPVFSLSDGIASAGMLAEFSGGAVSGVLDQSGGTAGSYPALTGQCTAPDTAGSDLVIVSAAWNPGASSAPANVITDGTGSSVTVTAYTEAATGDYQYDFCWGIAGTAGDDEDYFSGTLSSYSAGGCCIASFLAASGTVSGAASALALAAPAGSVRVDATVAGAVAVLAVTAPAGTPQSSAVVISGAVASLALAAPAGNVRRRGRGGSMLLFTAA